jgi:dolichyl-phosphate beta-glucosyltransferase
VENALTLSIVIPAFNEGERLGPTLERVIAWVDGSWPGAEILVVDDGSSDNTVEVAERHSPRVRVLKNGINRGKGYSVRHGVLESGGRLVLFIDADLSTPIEECRKLSQQMPHFDIAIGSRALAKSEVEKHQPFYREAMGKIFNRIVQIVAVGGIKDTQCGFKMLRGEVARELFTDMTIAGFAFDVELLLLAKQRGYSVAEVPVRWSNDERSSVHAVVDSLRMLRDVVRIRWTHRKGPKKISS